MQANMDHWDDDAANDSQQSLERCKLVEAMLQVPMTRGCVTLVATDSEIIRDPGPLLQLIYDVSKDAATVGYGLERNIFEHVMQGFWARGACESRPEIRSV